MCVLVTASNGATVASVKKDHINNIISNAKDCVDIDRIVIFGSSVEERCTEASDIDIAFFSTKPQMRFLSSKSFRDFMSKVYSFDEDQSYDVLYFKTGKDYKEPIYGEVMKGSEIYAKEGVEV